MEVMQKTPVEGEAFAAGNPGRAIVPHPIAAAALLLLAATGHYIQLEQPQLVIDAFRDVARSGQE
jgi:pimeloyl-ACP methyl ester carboxylesterase